MSKLTRALAVVMLIALCTGASEAQETKEVRKSGSLTADGRVYIDTYKGSIAVTAWDKAEFEVYAVIEPDGSGRHEEEKVQDTEIRIDVSSSSVRIKTDYDRVNRHSHSFWGLFDGESGNLPLVHYTVKMPRTACLVIKDYKSKTSVSDLRSDADIETYKGRVQVSNHDGSMALETYKGEVWVDFKNLSRKSRFETYKGEIEVKLPKGKGFDVDAEFGRRVDFQSDFDLDGKYRTSKRRDYDVRSSVNGGGPLLWLKSEKGTVRLVER